MAGDSDLPEKGPRGGFSVDALAQLEQFANKGLQSSLVLVYSTFLLSFFLDSLKERGVLSCRARLTPQKCPKC